MLEFSENKQNPSLHSQLYNFPDYKNQLCTNREDFFYCLEFEIKQKKEKNPLKCFIL